jgi:hypothetical protein
MKKIRGEPGGGVELLGEKTRLIRCGSRGRGFATRDPDNSEHGDFG